MKKETIMNKQRDSYRITDLLDGLEEAGQDLKPRGGSASRVKALTLSRLNGEAVPAAPVRRRFRPLTAAAAALAAVFLLGGTVFAAWKLGAFRFAEEFGPQGEVLDSYAQTYEPGSETPISADYGYASWVKAQAGDYNLVLRELTDYEGQLHAVVDVSPRDENTPAYRDSGLTLAFADYETVTAPPRQMNGWQDRVELFATLEAVLPEDAELAFSLSGPGREPALAVFSKDALDKAWEAMASSDRRHFATSAETKDFRFSLRSMTASPSTLYAVLDVEALSDWGAAHLDRVPEFAVYNHTHPISSTLLDGRLVASEEGLRRYIIGYVGTRPLNEAGDDIGFEILELFEEGDVAGHPYYLFHVELENLIPAAFTLTEPTGESETMIRWQSLSLDALGLSLTGSAGGSLESRNWELGNNGYPTVTLVFRDGTRELVMDSGKQPEAAPNSTHAAILRDWTGERDGSIHASLIFGQPLDPESLAEIIVDGQHFSLGE